MSIPRKGSRRIIINGCTHLCYIRHKVDHWALICGDSLVVGMVIEQPGRQPGSLPHRQLLEA